MKKHKESKQKYIREKLLLFWSWLKKLWLKLLLTQNFRKPLVIEVIYFLPKIIQYKQSVTLKKDSIEKWAYSTVCIVIFLFYPPFQISHCLCFAVSRIRGFSSKTLLLNFSICVGSFSSKKSPIRHFRRIRLNVIRCDKLSLFV